MNIFEKLKHGDPVDMMSEEYQIENMNIAEMSHEELVRLIAEKSDMLELDVLKAALAESTCWTAR